MAGGTNDDNTAHPQAPHLPPGRGRQPARHYQQALKHSETIGDVYAAGQARYDTAVLLAGEHRISDALAFARAALANFQQIGPAAADDVGRARQLITGLERQLTSSLEKET